MLMLMSERVSDIVTPWVLPGSHEPLTSKKTIVEQDQGSMWTEFDLSVDSKVQLMLAPIAPIAPRCTLCTALTFQPIAL